MTTRGTRRIVLLFTFAAGSSPSFTGSLTYHFRSGKTAPTWELAVSSP